VLELLLVEEVRLLRVKLPLEILDASGLCFEEALSKFHSELPKEEGILKIGLCLLEMIDFVSEMLKLPSLEGVVESLKMMRSTPLFVALLIPAKLEFELYFRSWLTFSSSRF
jgi:hypothetical protein